VAQPQPRPRNMPVAEIDASPELVRRLLASQHPDLAHLPIEVLANGWDNFICRLGDELLVRLPRRELAVKLVLHEQRWLPVLAPRLPLAVPAPVRIGRPAEADGYPWPWSIVPFLSGEVAASTPPADPGQAAISLGAFLRALHTPAPEDAPANPVRGVPLAGRSAIVAENIAILGDHIPARAVNDLWTRAKSTPPWDGPKLWLHGDLHTANILVHQGELSAVIDFGDITSGDPATDLSVAWMLFPGADYRDIFWAAYGQADHNTKARAVGWALSLALVFQAHSADNPLIAGIGHRTLSAVLG
jgi:aminoglycoside phosphotransferase (APT) family kinase protein